jgi:DNA-directed RNA polymerase specialized sigma24 family protein
VRHEGEGGRRELSDAELLTRLDGDPEAFGIFYERHAEPLLAYLLRFTRNEDVALDLIAELFATALKRRHRYREERGTVREWLVTIAVETLSISYRLHGVKDSARRRLGIKLTNSSRDEDWAAVEDRMRNATSGPLYEAAHYGNDIPIRKALGHRIWRTVR